MVADAYAGLRNMILTAKPIDVGLRPSPNEVWGVVAETGLTKAVVTLVAIADGTVSLYFSTGGGILGAGPHPGPSRVGGELIALAQQFVDRSLPTTRFPLPEVGFMRFYLLSGSGVLEMEAREDDLREKRQPFWPLAYKVQELISEIRLVEENQAN